MVDSLNCFKAYDVRGRVPEELNEEVAYRIGRAVVQYLEAKTVVVGRDVRLSSEQLAGALMRGIADQGADILDIGLCGTEEVYFATYDLGSSAGIMVTASHNPMDYNGMKFVREGARPISGDSGLHEIRALAEQGEFAPAAAGGTVRPVQSRGRYVEHLLGYVDRARLKPLKVVVNAGNGGAGSVVDALEPFLPFQFIKVHHAPDGNFPNGIPNPLLPENRGATAAAVREHGADLGIAWDGDFDRCFLFDEQGEFIEGYYIVGLLAEAFLRKFPGEKIVHDPRLTWNTIAVVTAAGGIPVQSKTGHAFIKERMRKEDAIYGGEMSAHHYFRDFAYCDSGMIPWLLVTELMSVADAPLSRLVGERIAEFPCSGEINFRVESTAAVLERVLKHYQGQAPQIDWVDGVGLDFGTWRFNLRGSNTEPVLRLNVESRGDAGLMEAKTREVGAIIQEGR